jgi:hypothetical protein
VARWATSVQVGEDSREDLADLLVAQQRSSWNLTNAAVPDSLRIDGEECSRNSAFHLNPKHRAKHKASLRASWVGLNLRTHHPVRIKGQQLVDMFRPQP